MIDTLVDLFLLISTDKKTISCTNMSTFYQFITKKIPEIENQRSNLISCFINQKIYKNDNNNNNEKSHHAKINGFIYKNEEIISKITRDITIKNFQNELLSLYNDMLDYLYEENIIILSDIQKNLLENKINKKLIEKKELYPGSYRLNSFVIKIIKKTEIRNHLIELINNNFVSFTFTIKDFINFFNSKNTKKNRDISETFVNLMNSIIKIYNVDKKILHAKKVSKNKTKSLGKIPVISINNNNILKEKSIKNKYTKKYINQFFHKINNSVNNKNREHFNLNNNCINKKKRKSISKKNNNQIINKETKNEDNNNLTQDTIPCQTLNNCYSLDNISKNCIYDNYLHNAMKNKKANIKKNVLFSEKNIKNNDLKYCCSKSQIDKITTANILAKKKVSKSALLNKDINEFIKNTYHDKNELEIYNDNKKERKNKLFFSYENQNENIFNERNKGCIIN
jgi:hypothetical protein